MATADALELAFSLLLEPVGFALMTLDVVEAFELLALPLPVAPLDDGVPFGSLDLLAVGGSFCFFSAGGLSFSEPDELLAVPPLGSSGGDSAFRFLWWRES